MVSHLFALFLTVVGGMAWWRYRFGKRGENYLDLRGRCYVDRTTLFLRCQTPVPRLDIPDISHRLDYFPSPPGGDLLFNIHTRRSGDATDRTRPNASAF